MTAKNIVTLLILTSFISCGTKSDDQSAAFDTTLIAGQEGTKSLIDDTVKVEDEFDYSDCIRGQAESVVKKSVYPNAVFKLNPDNHTGTEIVNLEDGDKLTIKNWGCEYYVLT